MVIQNTKNLINEAYKAIDIDAYQVARDKLLACLAQKDGFNVRYGLSVCFFNEFRRTGKESELDYAIEHAEKAADFFDAHFDVHLVLGQAYATKFFETKKEKFKQKALESYEKSRNLASKRPGMDPEDLEKRVDELIDELRS